MKNISIFLVILIIGLSGLIVPSYYNVYPLEQEPLISEEFQAPEEAKISKYIIRKINPYLYEEDYEAIMNARSYINKALNVDWPSENFTIWENTYTLIKDSWDFNNNIRYTYSIFDETGNDLIGSFYITNGNEEKNIDATVFAWMENENIKKGELKDFLINVKPWLEKEWPIKSIDYSLNSNLNSYVENL